MGAFVVDDDAARRAAGPRFAEAVPADAKAGTRAHMLSAALLDARAHPRIVVRSLTILGAGPRFAARMRIRVAGRDATIVAPFTLETDPNRVTASATFDLRQTALGLTPYRVLMGALRVRDRIRLAIRIVAERRAEAGSGGA